MVSKLIEEYKWGFFQDKSIGPHGPPPSATTETQALLWSCEITSNWSYVNVTETCVFCHLFPTAETRRTVRVSVRRWRNSEACEVTR